MPEISHPATPKQKIIDRTIQAGQGHVFRWWEQIDEEGRNQLLAQLSTIDFDELNRLYKHHKQGMAHMPEQEIEPAEIIPIPQNAKDIAEAERVSRIGKEAIKGGEVAIFMVAGGQATRLGIDAPKGTLKITPIRKKSIFQHHAEQILAISKRFKIRLPLYIMTSEANDTATRVFFEENMYFGLDPADVFLFKQKMMPALDLEGKLILDSRTHIFTNPDGHGGSISSLYVSGALSDMQERGVKHIFYFQVDNVLIKIADPTFLGYHIEEKADMSAKVTPKSGPDEKVGVLCRVGSEITVIEYSDLADKYKNALNEHGSLRFSSGNIAIHILDIDFVELLNTEQYSLPFHIAEKSIPYLDNDGRLVKPERPNGLKFEKFIFDALGRSKSIVAMEVIRELEFAPIKNAEGEDSPATACELMTNMYARWLEDCGMQVPRDSNNNVSGQIEISPLFALDEKELKQNLPNTFETKFPLYLGP